ncbi:MAG: Nicotinate phosphoribosyltransferase [Candidatus Erwinia impunctatus]|nr:Nicotinate phosphoribosyltransferase [Culicoides impunctatus]
MTRYDAPILTSILDTDAYKLHMQQAVFHHDPQVSVVAEFRCRGDELLGVYAAEIRQQIGLMRDLRLTNDEANWLGKHAIFQADYLAWLADFRFDPAQVTITDHQGELSIQIAGTWLEVIMWEVPLLALISEIVHRRRSPSITARIATECLETKLAHFRHVSQQDDLSGFSVMDFGTRRRFSKEVQQAVISCLQKNAGWLTGTSNYHFARHFALPAVGTQAHEWFQAHQQISPNLAGSQRAALLCWLEEYPDALGIALTDCISMDAFLRDFDLTLAQRYQGLRHDSGDPVAWGEKAIAHYQQLGIDPRKKTLVFSDNLDLDKALVLYRHFFQRTRVTFGIGTRLTCDIPQVTPLNIVIKLIECNGKPVAKLSDSPGKTICHDQAFVRALRKAFHLPQVRKAS